MSANIRTSHNSRKLQVGPVAVRSILSGRDTAGAFDLFELSADPGGFGPPVHRHPGTHETFHVAEGCMEFTVQGQAVAAPAGTTIHVPPGVPHTFRYIGPGRSRMLVTLTPSIDMETYFEQLAALMRVSNPPDRDKAISLMARHDTVLA